MKFDIKVRAKCTRFLLGLVMFLIPGLLFAQKNSTIYSEATMHKEEMDDEYLARDKTKGTSPAMKLRSATFFTIQVNVDENGNNLLGDAANEPSIALDPTNPNRMVIGWRQFDNVSSNFRQAGYAYTLDGGNSWTSPEPIDAGVFRSDPVLDADINGTIYYNSLTLTDNDDFYCDVYRSDAESSTWDNGTYAAGGDKQWMRIDKTDGPGSGHNYSFWTSYYSSCEPGAFTRSTDLGDSYEECVEVDQNPFWGTLAVASDGALYIAGRTNTGMGVVKSISAMNPDQTTDWEGYADIDLDGTTYSESDVNPGGLIGQTWIDIDNSGGPGDGNVYVLSSVRRYSNSDPADIMFTKSVDEGATWTSPLRINTDPTEDEFQWFGTMSVAPNGRIDVVWLDTRDSPSNEVLSALYYTYSIDQGETWTPEIKLSPLFDSHVGWPNQDKMGDYFDMVSTNNYAHLAWANTLNNEQDVYYGRIMPDIYEQNESFKQYKFNLNSFPNPATDNFKISFNLKSDTQVQLDLYNMFGQKVKEIQNETLSQGYQEFKVRTNNLPAGTYICKIQAYEQTQSTKVFIVK